MAADRVTAPAWLRHVAGRGRWIALPAGALLALAFAPAQVFLLAFACPAVLFLLWHDATPREAAWRGFLFTGGTFLGRHVLAVSQHPPGRARRRSGSRCC